MRKILVGIMALMLSAMTVWAERVTESDAALVANHFMNVASANSGVKKAPAKRMVLKQAPAAQANQYFIYENANGEGWVMVAANDVVRPILAYSETGHFRTDDQPANVKCWLGKYNKQIKHAEENGVSATEEVKREWKRLRKGVSPRKATPVVAPLIQTMWDQDDPYWNNCPKKNADRCYTGCVATAMAQVMYYWKWPKQGTGSYSYTTETLKLSCSADFANTTYDWNNMLLKYNGYYPEGSGTWTTSGVPTPTTAQKEAIATLMYHCGVAVGMNYNIASAGGSSAYTIYPNKSYTNYRCAQDALWRYFGYNSSTIKGYYRPGGYGYSAVSDADWHNYLKTELDAARPIMYAGADDDSGHSFICDGYDNTTPTRKYHFNWGWSGYCDGYYDVDNLVPGTGGSGSGNGSYNDGQDIIIGIQPNILGHSVIKNATGCTISCAGVAENDKAFTATITPTDETYDFTSLTVKLGSSTLQQTTHYTLSSDKKSLTVLASAITGDAANDLTITAVWTKNRYKYEMLGENCDPEMDEGTLSKNAALNLTIMPASGYTLADAECWDVEMGGTALTYGVGFTYNAATGAFQIASVTGDVAIFVYGGKQVTWMARGEVFATNMTSGDKYVLPTDEPESCSDGREFVGWCATANYQSEDVAPTFVQDGDAANQGYTLYAVFAEASGSATSSWTLVANASSLKAGDKLVIANKANDATAGTLSSQILSSISSTFSGNEITSLGTNTLEFTLGGTSGAWTLSTSEGLLGATSAKKLAWGNGTTTWSISIENGGDATIQNGNNSYGRFLYNTNSPRFTTYTSASSETMLLPQLYRKSSATSYINYTTTCTAPEPVYYTIRFFNNGLQIGETQSVLKNHQAEKPTDPTPLCADYTFVGWWTAELAADNTAPKSWVSDFKATKDQDYYAVYSKTVSGGTVLTNDYKKITTTSELATGNYIVVGYKTNYYAMLNELKSSYYIDQKQVTPSSNIITTTDGSIIWKITKNGNQLSFFNEESGKYVRLYQSGTHTNAGLTTNTSDNIKFTYSVNNGSWDFVNTVLTSYHLEYYGQYSEFTAYTSAGDPIHLFKQQEEEISTTYYSSVVSCSGTGVENIQVGEKAVKVIENGQIVIVRGKEKYTIFGQKIQ